MFLFLDFFLFKRIFRFLILSKSFWVVDREIKFQAWSNGLTFKISRLSKRSQFLQYIKKTSTFSTLRVTSGKKSTLPKAKKDAKTIRKC